MLTWFLFILCALAIVYAGAKLSRYGDVIAEKTGMGGTWIGVLLMATITSLPEMVTGASSVLISSTPEIATGSVLGSCTFNLLILAGLDAMHRPKPISARAHQGQILSAGFGIILLAAVLLALHTTGRTAPLGWVDPFSILYIAIYTMAIRLVFSYEKRQLAQFFRETTTVLKYDHITLRSAICRYTINAAVVTIAAMILPAVGKKIAAMTGLGESFVGTLFIAVATSLPEVVVAISAVKIGAVDLAIGNLFGSNIFNILILAIDDILFIQGPLLSFVSPLHAISALSAIIMTSIAIIGLTYRAENKRLFLAWDSAAIIAVFIVNIMLHYRLR